MIAPLTLSVISESPFDKLRVTKATTARALVSFLACALVCHGELVEP